MMGMETLAIPWDIIFFFLDDGWMGWMDGRWRGLDRRWG